MSPTADPLLFRACASLERQLREHEVYIVSQDELWRSAGSPEGLKPGIWLFRVKDLLADLSRNVAQLDPECRLLQEEPRAAVWCWPAGFEPPGDWQAGDTMAIRPVGSLYALALDTWPDDPDRSAHGPVGRTTTDIPTGPEPG